MRTEVKQFLEQDIILLKDLQKQITKYEADPEIQKWKKDLKKAREEGAYREGVYIVCWLLGRTPEQLVHDGLEDMKKHGHITCLNEAAKELDFVLQKLRKNNGEEYAPSSLGARFCGYMSFVSNQTGHELEKKAQDRYSKYKAPSDEHIQRKQLMRTELFKAIDHSTLMQKALILVTAQTGLSRSDWETARIPEDFFEQLERTEIDQSDYEEGDFPAALLPCAIFFYKRAKTQNRKPTYGLVPVYGDAARYWLAYAREKGLQPGDPFFIGHNREAITKEGVYKSVNKVRERAGISHLVPKLLREYSGGVFKSYKVPKAVRAIMTAHYSGGVSEAYTFKRDIYATIVDTWKEFNPDVYRERRAIAAEKKARTLEERLTGLEGKLTTLTDIMVQTLGNGRAEMLKEAMQEGAVQ